MNRWWLSWYQPGPDHRPLAYPPNDQILGWWCTGQGGPVAGSNVDLFTLCALVEAKTEAAAWKAVRKDWPDMGSERFIGKRQPDYVIQSDRFPLSDWMKPRMTKGGV